MKTIRKHLGGSVIGIVIIMLIMYVLIALAIDTFIVRNNNVTVNDFTDGFFDDVRGEEGGSGEETENGESGENGVVDPNFLSKSSEVVAIGMQRTVIVPNVNEELLKRFKATYPTTEEEAEGYFSLASILIEGIKNGGTRRLSEEQRYDILKRTKEVATEWDLKDKPFTTFELRLQNIYYHKIKATSDAFEQYKQSKTEWKP